MRSEHCWLISSAMKIVQKLIELIQSIYCGQRFIMGRIVADFDRNLMLSDSFIQHQFLLFVVSRILPMTLQCCKKSFPFHRRHDYFYKQNNLIFAHSEEHWENVAKGLFLGIQCIFCRPVDIWKMMWSISCQTPSLPRDVFPDTHFRMVPRATCCTIPPQYIINTQAAIKHASLTALPWFPVNVQAA